MRGDAAAVSMMHIVRLMENALTETFGISAKRQLLEYTYDRVMLAHCMFCTFIMILVNGGVMRPLDLDAAQNACIMYFESYAIDYLV